MSSTSKDARELQAKLEAALRRIDIEHAFLESEAAKVEKLEQEIAKLKAELAEARKRIPTMPKQYPCEPILREPKHDPYNPSGHWTQ